MLYKRVGGVFRAGTGRRAQDRGATLACLASAIEPDIQRDVDHLSRAFRT